MSAQIELPVSESHNSPAGEADRTTEALARIGEVSSSADLDARPEPQEAPDAPVRPRFAWVREVAVILGFYYVYQAVRSLADQGSGKTRAHANARHLVEFERWLHIFHEQSIQNAFLGLYWFIRGLNIYYGTLHFVVTIGLLVWLWARRYPAYRKMRNLLGVATGLALIGYFAFPLAPPRLYTCNNDVPVLGPQGPTIGRCFVDTLDQYGGLWSYTSPAAKAVANQYAAMPSLHFGWALWCAVVMWVYIGSRRAKVLAVIYPLLTLFAIVVTANHYFLDAVGGAVVLGGAYLLLEFRDRRRLAKQAAVAEAPVAAGGTEPEAVEPSPA